MDIEQLKLIIQAAGEAGDGVVQLAVVWLAKDFIIQLSGYGVLVFVIVKAASILTGLIHKSQFHSQMMQEIGATAYLDSADQRRVIELIRAGINAEQNQQK